MKLYALIGHPLTHSRSKDYWNQKFKEEGLSEYRYENFDLSTVDQVPTLLREQPDLHGFNVTIPHKRTIIEYLDELDDTAREIGAVNTVRVKDGQLIGYNTDAYGFKLSIRPFLEPKHDRALILGTGGAARAVRYVLEQLGIPSIMVSRMPFGENKISYADLNEGVVKACKLIVNATPQGMSPHIDRFPPFNYEAIGTDHFVIDLIYNPKKTAFLQKAEAQGAMILNGEDMLRFQAEGAWHIWNGDQS